MSVSIKRLVYEDSPFGGSAEANWFHNHFRGDSSGPQESKFYIRRDTLEEDLKSARECSGNCEFFEQGKEEHDRITKEMEVALPKLLEELKSDWVDLEAWW